jgi:hypothetical protein
VCACRVPILYAENACFHGDCQVDADCPGSYCSPSALDSEPGDFPAGSVGFFCHTASDGCTDDADCPGDRYEACTFDAAQARWRCFF